MIRRPDFTNTEPAAELGPFPQWGDKKKIVAMDPWGHLGPWLFKDMIEKEDGLYSGLMFVRHYPDAPQLIFDRRSPLRKHT